MLQRRQEENETESQARDALRALCDVDWPEKARKTGEEVVVGKKKGGKEGGRSESTTLPTGGTLAENAGRRRRR